MASIPANQEEKALRFLRYVAFLLKSDRPKNEIAADLGFGSPEALYQRLKQDGSPICEVCGEPYAEPGHCERSEKKRGPGSGKGEPIELPPAKEAAPLFKEALDKLLGQAEFMQRDHESASSSRYSKEYLQGGLFFQYTREEIHWTDGLGRTRYTPARRSPGNGLTELIAAYLLVYGNPEPLIEKLHHDPNSLDRERLRKHIEGESTRDGRKPGLFGSAEDVAILIRGGDHLRPGRRAGEFDVDEQIARQRIIEGRQEGYSDQQIIEMLSQEGISASKAELRRLGRLDPPDPSS